MQTMQTITRSTSVLAGLGFGMTLGCLSLRPNPDHCSNRDGNATCASLYGDERPFCSWGRGACESTPAKDGCVEAKPSEECYSPCGGAALVEDDASCLGGTGSGTDDGATTDAGDGSTTRIPDGSESSSTGPSPCAGNEDCTDPAAPFCEPMTGACVTCAATADPDGACAELDAGAPLCIDGACVQCTASSTAVCDELLFLCDDASKSCVPCTAHEQCSSGACQLAVGQCFPEGEVLHVDGDGGTAYMTVASAVGAVPNGTSAVIVVHELDSGGSYQGSVLLDGGKTIALLGAPGENPSIQGIGANPGLSVTGASTTVYVDALELSNATTMGVVVEGGLAWVDRSRIVGNDGGGILAQNGAQLTLRNCFVGGSVNNVASTTVNGSMATVLYSTLAAGYGTATAVTCDGAATVEIRNSLLVAETDSDEIQCAGASIEYTAAEMNVGGTNTGLGDMSTAWFIAYGSGDFHLAAMPPIAIATTARWEAGDPPIDIDGEERSAVDGAADVAGADVP